MQGPDSSNLQISDLQALQELLDPRNQFPGPGSREQTIPRDYYML